MGCTERGDKRVRCKNVIVVLKSFKLIYSHNAICHIADWLAKRAEENGWVNCSAGEKKTYREKTTWHCPRALIYWCFTLTSFTLHFPFIEQLLLMCQRATRMRVCVCARSLIREQLRAIACARDDAVCLLDVLHKSCLRHTRREKDLIRAFKFHILAEYCCYCAALTDLSAAVAAIAVATHSSSSRFAKQRNMIQKNTRVATAHAHDIHPK